LKKKKGRRGTPRKKKLFSFRIQGNQKKGIPLRCTQQGKNREPLQEGGEEKKKKDAKRGGS